MDSMDNPANFAIEPSISEHSEEFKNRFSMNSSASKPDSSEQSITAKLDSLILMQSRFQNNIFDSLSQTLENLLNEKFESILKERLEVIQVQNEYNSQKLSKSKIMKFEQRQDSSEFEEKAQKKKNDLREKFEELIQKNRDFEGLVRENEKLRNEKEILENMHESVSKVNQDLKESLFQEKKQKEKFIHLFYESRKNLEKVNKMLKQQEEEKLENLAKYEESGKKIRSLNEENLASLAKFEESNIKIQNLIEEIKNLKNLLNTQNAKILKLKRVKRETDRKNFKKILLNNSNEISEVKKKLDDLHQNILNKINELGSFQLDETTENFSGVQGNQFEYLDYLKNYSEIIEKQIIDLEFMEKEIEDSENVDDLLIKFQEKNQSFNEEKGFFLDILTLSSDDEAR